MKILLLTLFTLVTTIVSAQLPYSWTSGVNPGWTSSDNILRYRGGCGVVTTNCNGNYSNNINSFYTSPIIDATCNNASSISITFTASGNAEYGYDFLFIEYSLDGGTNWINPYGIGVGWTGNFGAGTTIPPIIVPTSNNFRFRFNFYSDFIYTYSGYDILDFDILCNVVLPIELISFDGYNKGDTNVLNWVTATEINNDYFDVEKSIDGYTFTKIDRIKGAGNSNTPIMYEYKDGNVYEELTYYRLKQVDYDGNFEYHNIITISKLDDGNNYDAILYPNPTKGTFKISDMNLNDIINITITNSIGEIIYQSYIYNGDISLNKEPNGLYIVSIYTNSGTIFRRLIKE